MKTKKQLSKSPLTYVLAQVKISPIQKLEDYIPKLQELIRKDFPLFKTLKIKTVEIEPNGQPQFPEATLWHFSDKTSTTGILAGTNAIMLHTTQYDSFASLVKKLAEVLTKFNDVLSISICMRVGLRYINVIHSEPEKYLKRELLGFYLDEGKHFKSKYMLTTETIQETTQGIAKIRAYHYYSKDVRRTANEKEILVPEELKFSVDYLDFDKHQDKIPTESYALLDIDHFSEKNEDFNMGSVKNKLHELHEGIETIFNHAVTEKALKDWK